MKYKYLILFGVCFLLLGCSVPYLKLLTNKSDSIIRVSYEIESKSFPLDANGKYFSESTLFSEPFVFNILDSLNSRELLKSLADSIKLIDYRLRPLVDYVEKDSLFKLQISINLEPNQSLFFGSVFHRNLPSIILWEHNLTVITKDDTLSSKQLGLLYDTLDVKRINGLYLTNFIIE